MLLLELPPELLIVLFESLPDARTLCNLIQTCHYAQSIYFKDTLSILNNVIKNAYSEMDSTVKDAIIASESHAELDYSYNLTDRSVQWIPPQASNPWTPENLTKEKSINLLHTLVDFETDTLNLASWCAPRYLRRKPSSSTVDTSPADIIHRFWARKFLKPTPDTLPPDDIIQELIRLQLVTNRLYNVRLPAFPEHISLREYERDKPATSPKATTTKVGGRIPQTAPSPFRDLWTVSRKTVNQAQDLMTDALRTIPVENLRNMWFLIQTMQDAHQLLRRHRLRPRTGSLMDLLFEHNSDESGWSPSPWFALQSLLSDEGVHVVPARPGTQFRFLGQEAAYEVQFEDIQAFDRYLETLQMENMEEACFPLCSRCPIRGCEGLECVNGYLERYRPLLGLGYLEGDKAIAELVEPKAVVRSTVGTSRYWSRAGSTMVEQSRLGEALTECGEKNMRRKVELSKSRLRGGRSECSGSRSNTWMVSRKSNAAEKCYESSVPRRSLAYIRR